MTKLQRFLLQWVARRIVIPGGHDIRIIEAYQIIYDATKTEFFEDNKPTLDAFLQDCFDKAKKWD